MSITDLPPCGWRASSGLQYLQAVTFAPPPGGCVVAPFCGPPASCTCPAPVSGGCWIPVALPAKPAEAEPPKPAPPKLPKPASFKPPKFEGSPGVNFIPPKNITTLFIFAEIGPPKNGSLKFQPWQIDSSKTVRDILDHLGKGDEKWNVVEYFEAGDGKWDKGITVGYKSDRAKKEISKFGWTPKRGGALPPVWLATEQKE